VLAGFTKIGACRYIMRRAARRGRRQEEAMAWTTPTLVEICVGLEINAYLPAEF